jgi:hypothetical protein
MNKFKFLNYFNERRIDLMKAVPPRPLSTWRKALGKKEGARGKGVIGKTRV